MDDIEVLGCGIISWKPPRGNEDCGGLGYVVRFFDGETYVSTPSSGYRSLQRYFDEIGRQWAVGEDLPTDGRTVYADVSGIFYTFLSSSLYFYQIRARNGDLSGPYSEIIIVAS